MTAASATVQQHCSNISENTVDVDSMHITMDSFSRVFADRSCAHEILTTASLAGNNIANC